MIRLLTAVCSISVLLLAWAPPETADALPSNCFTGSLPTTPQVPNYTLELSPNSSFNHARLVLWRQVCPSVPGETAVLVRITPVSNVPSVCSADFVIIQNSLQIDGQITTINGLPFCAGLLVPSTFLLVEATGQPVFHETQPFRLVYLGSPITSIDVPAGEGGPSHDPTPRLANISTRGVVGTDDNVLIAGVILGGDAPKQILVRAIGPSLAGFGVPGALANPFLRLYSGQTAIAENDNWQVPMPLCSITGNTCGTPSDITATGLAPTNPLESAILIRLSPGAYTAIVSGVDGTTGVGLVEVFEVPFDQ